MSMHQFSIIQSSDVTRRVRWLRFLAACCFARLQVTGGEVKHEIARIFANLRQAERRRMQRSNAKQ